MEDLIFRHLKIILDESRTHAHTALGIFRFSPPKIEPKSSQIRENWNYDFFFLKKDERDDRIFLVRERRQRARRTTIENARNRKKRDGKRWGKKKEKKQLILFTSWPPGRNEGMQPLDRFIFALLSASPGSTARLFLKERTMRRCHVYVVVLLVGEKNFRRVSQSIKARA